jgi:hypothetical protein
VPSATALDPFEPVIAAGFVIATIALLVSAPPKERFLRAARKRSDMRGPGSRLHRWGWRGPAIARRRCSRVLKVTALWT